MSHEKMFTNLDLDVLYTIMNGQRNSHTNIIFTQNETMKAHTFYKISSLPCLVMRGPAMKVATKYSKNNLNFAQPTLNDTL